MRSDQIGEIHEMLEIEAERLSEIILSQTDISPLLNLGSSTLLFRQHAQPHIERCLFGPLQRADVKVVHCDLKVGDGIDVSGDVLDPVLAGALKRRGFRCILVANLLEHVRDRQAVANACEDIVGSGGLILATAPRSYPYHADPIDKLYRPTPDDLADLFKRSQPVLAEELVGPTYAEEMSAREGNMRRELSVTVSSLLMAWLYPRGFISRAHRWLWLRRPYRVSIAMMVVS